MTWCQDKVLTLRRLASVGLRVPRQQVAGNPVADADFLREQPCASEKFQLRGLKFLETSDFVRQLHFR